MKQIDGAPTTRGILDAAMSEDGAALGALPLARDLARPHAGADGRHRGEPSPFHDGDLVGTVGPICVGSRMRPDAGEAGESAIGKTAVDGPVRVTRTRTPPAVGSPSERIAPSSTSSMPPRSPGTTSMFSPSRPGATPPSTPFQCACSAASMT